MLRLPTTFLVVASQFATMSGRFGGRSPAGRGPPGGRSPGGRGPPGGRGFGGRGRGGGGRGFEEGPPAEVCGKDV
jgi:hypothetical protein